MLESFALRILSPLVTRQRLHLLTEVMEQNSNIPSVVGILPKPPKFTNKRVWEEVTFETLLLRHQSLVPCFSVSNSSAEDSIKDRALSDLVAMPWGRSWLGKVSTPPGLELG